nr:hypothetical protein BaRGS_020252 [Batillaria attramentaria]
MTRLVIYPTKDMMKKKSDRKSCAIADPRLEICVASKAIDGVLFGYIMVFYIPFHLRPSRYMYLVYYALFYTENFLMLALWAGMTSDRDAWFYIPAIVTVIVLFLLHIVAQLLYYKSDILSRTISREYRQDTGFRPAKFENDMSVLPFSV